MTTKFITLRFNIAKERHRRGLEILEKQHEAEGRSYTDVVLQTLLRDAEGEAEQKNDGERGCQSCVAKITAATEAMLRNALLPLFAVMPAQASAPSAELAATPSTPGQEEDNESDIDTIPDDEIPWDYLEG